MLLEAFLVSLPARFNIELISVNLLQERRRILSDNGFWLFLRQVYLIEACLLDLLFWFTDANSLRILRWICLCKDVAWWSLTPIWLFKLIKTHLRTFDWGSVVGLWVSSRLFHYLTRERKSCLIVLNDVYCGRFLLHIKSTPLWQLTSKLPFTW